VSVADLVWREAVRWRWKGQALAVSRGVLLAAPLLLHFGALLVAADAVCERLVLDIFGFDLAEVFSHLFLITFFAWITAGLLWAELMARVPENFAIPRPRVLSLGIVEIGIVLGLLDLLFLTFVVIQVRYLFGGAGRVAATAGLTYAEYARRGFFELVTVTALALPLLLIAQWLLRAENRAHERLFKALAGIMVGLLFVVVASALQRMYLYQQEFGLTELRLYTPVFTAWISTVLLWFVLTVLRARRDRFAFGALLTRFRSHLSHKRHQPRCPHSKHQHRPHGKWKALRRLLPDHPERRRRARARRVSPRDRRRAPLERLHRGAGSCGSLGLQTG
jgi:hypothetical protein